jgi:hypothetical protein
MHPKLSWPGPAIFKQKLIKCALEALVLALN